jgi:hypothetical protein
MVTKLLAVTLAQTSLNIWALTDGPGEAQKAGIESSMKVVSSMLHVA